MSAQYKRSVRVADLLKRELAGLLLRKIKDPRLDGITITGVKITDDLRQARVYFVTPSGDEKRMMQALLGLKSAGGFMRREIGHSLRLKYVPQLEFEYDRSFDYAQRIETLLHRIGHDEPV